MITKKKDVLIATPIDESKRRIFRRYAKGVKLQDRHVLLLDTTQDKKFFELAQEYGFIYEDLLPTKKMMDIVVDARNFCINFARNNGFTHIFFVDSDIVLEDNILDKLLTYNKKIVAANYWGKDSKGKKFSVHNIEIEDQYIGVQKKDLNQGLIEVSQIAFGCTLIDLSVFKDIKIRCERDKKGKMVRGEDYCFSNDYYIDKGKKMYLDTDITVKHFPTHQWLKVDA